MIWAFIARTPDILQFIGLGTVVGFISLGVWKAAGLMNRIRGPRRR